MDVDARIAAKEGSIETKPHGHGASTAIGNGKVLILQLTQRKLSLTSGETTIHRRDQRNKNNTV